MTSGWLAARLCQEVIMRRGVRALLTIVPLLAVVGVPPAEGPAPTKPGPPKEPLVIDFTEKAGVSRMFLDVEVLSPAGQAFWDFLVGEGAGWLPELPDPAR